MTERLSVYCADVGSVAAGNFAWSGRPVGASSLSGRTMPELAEAVAKDLNADCRVALGFECPLFVPLRDQPARLTAARLGDGNRSWSAGAGCGALTTGLVQVVWLLREIRRLVRTGCPAFVDWDDFSVVSSGLFVWEAFVSGVSKGTGHLADAELAVVAFARAITKPTLASTISVDAEVYSLVGAALLRSGWSVDVALLTKPCVVVRVEPDAV